MEEARPQEASGFPATGAADIPTDAQLLGRFASLRDEAAFALLVERHGPLVLGVCRRVLGVVQDAEDAFQATFMVLARRAGSIREPHLLGNWLYGVASRIARKLRAGLSKRQMHEKQLRLIPSMETSPPVVESDLGPVLDEELSRLPEKYRVALVLCYLQGKTNEEAARLLRWPTGTVKGRLARARDLLRNRLIRRGLDVSALVLTAALLTARADAGPVPAALAASTVSAGVTYAGGGATASAPSTSAATRLADRFLAARPRIRLVGAALLIMAVLLGTAIWLIGSGAAGYEMHWRPGAKGAGVSGSEGSGAPAPPVHSCHPAP